MHMTLNSMEDRKSILGVMLLCFIMAPVVPLDLSQYENELNMDSSSYRFDSEGEAEGYIYQRDKRSLRIIDTSKHISYDPVLYEEKSIPLIDMDYEAETGYITFDLDGMPAYLILGDNFLVVSCKNSRNSMTRSTEPEYKVNKNFFDACVSRGREIFTYSMGNGIRNVISSSFYTEQYEGHQIQYSGYNLDILYSGVMDGMHINPYCFPWVENAEGPGEGEWIEFELESPQNETYILNGFVDAIRPNLFKDNSRIKTAKIIGTTTKHTIIEQTVTFEDFVYFKTVKFPEPVNKFRIVIQSIYPGAKWEDTAISAVLFPDVYNERDKRRDAQQRKLQQ